LVRWQGWPIWEATWERRQNLDGAAKVVEDFEATLQQTTLQVNGLSLSSAREVLKTTSAPPPVPASRSVLRVNSMNTQPTSARRSGPMQPSPAQGCTMQLPRARRGHTGRQHCQQQQVTVISTKTDSI